jgi:putative Mg2+ transporter-C (MgtC) family protein
MPLTFELELSLQLLAAAFLGAAIGAEREIHGHAAGMRTHLLVGVGSALFTILSIYGVLGISGTGPVDPTRIAAQIVSGIGFLGAGAIIKEGFSVRGLTTAASLWATAAIGMAAGAGEIALAVVVTLIVLASLWPLNYIAERISATRSTSTQVRVELSSLDALEGVRAAIAELGGRVTGVDIERGSRGERAATLEVFLGAGRKDPVDLARGVGAVEGVTGVTTERQE